MARRWPRSANRRATSLPSPPVPPVMTLMAPSTTAPSRRLMVTRGGLAGTSGGVPGELDAGAGESVDHRGGVEGAVPGAGASGRHRAGHDQVGQGGGGEGGGARQGGEPSVVDVFDLVAGRAPLAPAVGPRPHPPH